MNNGLIEAEGLVLSPYPEATPFDFTLVSGARWRIRGPSRSGKSPFLKTLCGLISPAAGSVHLFGQRLGDLSPDALLSLRQHLGFVSVQDGLLPAWSGFENLALPLKYHTHASTTEIVQQVEQFAQRYEVSADWLNFPVAQLGAEQRLALALMRALLPGPRLLIIDGTPLNAVFAASGMRCEAMLDDALDGDMALILAQPEDGSGALPGALERIVFQTAQMRLGRLECQA